MLQYLILTYLCVSMNIFMCYQGSNDKDSFEKLIKAIKSSKNGKLVGIFGKEKYPGVFLDAWRSEFDKENFETVSYVIQYINKVSYKYFNKYFIKVDISSAIGYILSIKAENEITLIKKASLSSVEMFTKYLKEQIMEIIDSDKVNIYG